MPCSIEGCDKDEFGRGWCSMHYARWKRHGDPLVISRQSPMRPDATEKHCPRCGNKKPLEMFGKRPSGKPKGYCLECESRYQDRYAGTSDGRENRRLARSKWNDGNHGYFLMYRYGITAEQYAEMLATQDGRCAICGTDKPSGRDKVFAVDHCHDSLKVRGLLCGLCNRGLGQFGDDLARLRAAVAYLERSET